METTKRVLVACPTSEYKDYCFDDWAQCVNALTHLHKDILIVDNSRNPEYQNKIKSKGFRCIHRPPLPGESTREYIFECQKIITSYVLEHGYHYWLSVESDIFLPVNSIEYLISLNKMVCGFPYFTWTGAQTSVLWQIIEDMGLCRQAMNLGVLNSFNMIDGKIKPGYQTGIGCMLVNSKVLEKIPLRIEIDSPTLSHSDTFFHQDLYNAGIPVWIDTSVIVEHRNQSWEVINKKENV